MSEVSANPTSSTEITECEKLADENIVESSTVDPSAVDASSVDASTVDPSNVDESTVVPSTVDESTVVPSTVDESTVDESTVVPSTVVPNTVVPSTVDASNVVPSAAEPMEKAPVANDVQRAIDGLKEIPDEEFQEFLNDEAFMKDLDVVDSWGADKDAAKRDADENTRRRSDSQTDCRDRWRRNRKSPQNRDARRDDRKHRDVGRRDPHKSSKDIERDKQRAKKDSANKILAEQEKAIKHLLDSGTIVPPGTEVEVIQDLTEKQQKTETGRYDSRSRKSRERRRSHDRLRLTPPRRRSNDRFRPSPHRRRSDDRRLLRLTPERRRVMGSPDSRRSWDRRSSEERHRRREEREQRLAARRSRSRERHRSRSSDRYRKRYSRSPVSRRASPRRRTRSRSRSRTPDRRTRKRSPFINELARTFRNEGLIPGGPANFLPGIPPLVGQSFGQNQSTPMNPGPMGFMGLPGPPVPGPMIMQQAAAPGFMNFEHNRSVAPHMNYDARQGIQHSLHQTEFAAGPVMYNPGNPPGAMQQQSVHGMTGMAMPMQSPQPVPAPVTSEHDSLNYNQTRGNPSVATTSSQQQRTTTTHNGVHGKRSERLKTPEPPVISNSQRFEKTSLSSLLEASVTPKDPHGGPVLYPGFKPEILRNCELALRELPPEDLRLRMKGRFFFDPNVENVPREPENLGSNSILLMRSGKTNIYWDDDRKSQNSVQFRSIVEVHQKLCQTDGVETESRGTQVVINPVTADFSMQVSAYDLQQTTKEEKRPIMDRLDWNMRETYDYAPKMREADDLRWSLSNSSQKKPWNRAVSPDRVIDEEREMSPGRMSTSDHDSRSINVGSSTRTRDDYSYRRSRSREHYSRDRYSPSYRRSPERNDDFCESRSDHSRGESPMALEDSTDEVEVVRDQHFPRGDDWRSRGKSSYRSGNSLGKIRVVRGNPGGGRSYSGRAGFHGQF